MAVRQRKSKKLPRSAQAGPETSKKEEMSQMRRLRDFLRRQPVWMVLAVSSGACAAFNGVFAKL